MTEPFPEKLTLEEKYGPAMKITDQAEADAYFERCVEHTVRVDKTPREEAERIIRTNLGYYAGYYSAETRERVERLFKCEHPVFGKIAERGQPTTEEAFKAGIEIGRRAGMLTATWPRVAFDLSDPTPIALDYEDMK